MTEDNNIIVPQPIVIPTIYDVKTDGKVSLNLHEGQTRAWDSLARYVAVIAGTQSGKTSFGPWWLWREIMMCGAGDYLAVTATYDLFKLKMLPEIRNVFEHILQIGRFWAGAGIIELKDPRTDLFLAKRSDDPNMYARIILRSASSGSGLESNTGRGAWLDEAGMDAFYLESFEAVIRRLSLTRGRLLITTTPYNLGWLKQTIVDKASEDDTIDVINFASIINPAFSKEEYEEREKKMATEKFQMFYQGLFSKPAGMILKDFKFEYDYDGGHRVAPFEIPKEWRTFIAIDPGGANQAQLWFAHDDYYDIYYLFYEQMVGGKATPEKVTEALKYAEDNRLRIRAWYVGQPSETQVRRDYKSAGAKNVKAPPFSDVEQGIDRIIQLMREDRLYIFDTCTITLDQIGTYSRVLDKITNEPTDKIKNKEKYHCIDALRYMAVNEVKEGRFNSIHTLRNRR